MNGIMNGVMNGVMDGVMDGNRGDPGSTSDRNISLNGPQEGTKSVISGIDWSSVDKSPLELSVSGPDRLT